MPQNLYDNNDLNSILDKLIETYRDVYGDKVRSVILYGSYARGDNRQNSDIDVAAIVDGDRSDLQSQLRRIWDVSSDLELEYEVIVSPTVIPSEEFDHYKNALPYYRNIENEGVNLLAG